MLSNEEIKKLLKWASPKTSAKLTKMLVENQINENDEN